VSVVADGFAWKDGVLQRRAVVQCALSRICGACGRPLGRPVAFVGDADEVERGTFHSPPLHVACAEDLRAADPRVAGVVLTAGFEFVRPGREDLDPEPRFEPNSLL
jgi:hypothetical protein